MTLISTFLFGIIVFSNNPDSINPKIDLLNYRAAKYSMVLDFSKAQHVVPEIIYTIPDLSTIIYKYIIQYGKSILIEIINPGNEINSFTAFIRKTDYSARVSTFTCFIDYARNYFSSSDSIKYSIEENQGTVTNMCEEVISKLNCDSLTFCLFASKHKYTVIINDSIPNLRSNFLFYPDIKYLPNKVIGIGPDKNTMILEEIICGKQRIDSLLQLYNYTDYEQITSDELDPDYRQRVIDLIEELKEKE